MQSHPGPDPWTGAGSLNLQIYACQRIQLSRSWRVKQPRRAFWRVYWNRQAGATVHWQGSDIDLTPDRLVIIAPHTSFRTSLTQAVDHSYIHLGMTPTAEHPTNQVLIHPFTATDHASAESVFESHPTTVPMRHIWQVMTWIASALSSAPADMWPQARPPHRLAFICAMIDRVPGRAWRNSELARHAGMATNAFIRLFTQLVGQPPQHYVRERRLAEAALLLEHSEFSLEQIADSCGFASRSHFSTMFKHWSGTPPAQWRREAQSASVAEGP